MLSRWKWTGIRMSSSRPRSKWRVPSAALPLRPRKSSRSTVKLTTAVSNSMTKKMWSSSVAESLGRFISSHSSTPKSTLMLRKAARLPVECVLKLVMRSLRTFSPITQFWTCARTANWSCPRTLWSFIRLLCATTSRQFGWWMKTTRKGLRRKRRVLEARSPREQQENNSHPPNHLLRLHMIEQMPSPILPSDDSRG